MEEELGYVTWGISQDAEDSSGTDIMDGACVESALGSGKALASNPSSAYKGL